MWLIYDLIIRLYGCSISLAALFNLKAKKWVQGRRSAPSLSPSPNLGRDGVGAIAWFHCASLGEFEQGRPVIEAFRAMHPDWKIVLTFFSPSGYEVRKNYPVADEVFYLPLDTRRNARKFIRLVRPSMAVFVKYEFWFRHLDELYKNNIPTYVISANFRKNHHFFRWYGAWARKQLHKVTRFFVQHEESARLLKDHGIENVTVSGDTRFDRVAEIAAHAKTFPLVEKFAAGKPVFLAGSTWPADEELILNLIAAHGDKMKFIIAPHEVDERRISGLRQSFKIPNSEFRIPNIKLSTQNSKLRTQNSELRTQNSELRTCLFSQLTEDNALSSNILIIDNIGHLAHLYQYATIAYIGGGFGAGIHNILEAAAFGKPVIFGPKYHKFREAIELTETSGAFPIYNSQQLNTRTIELLQDQNRWQNASVACLAYIQQKKGATGKILSLI
ncbi:MAG: 3-deoxy-D-manno-octulosonic acid transferase [Bacteroidales bacterium]|nr:3-deoxy-D-manno-octulosonic acid transferase [Bacteroidales bacterium]